MPLSAGTRLGSYEISALLGAGGMGEVYRARDTKLGRDVALKVLLGEVSADPDRRRRFEAEARSASALNHPNIVTVYDIDVADSTIYIAMELVEGRMLRELILDGALPVRKTLDIAVQAAEGLAKAHAAGIVHRDLKPENLMVSRDGYVKILDFGLAKLVEPVREPEGLSALQTMAAPAPATQPGTVLGTAGYMSPEQASGGSVDFRSDQFALGAILYEMSTNRRAFQRKTGAETLVAIIREEPEPIAGLNPAVPAPLRWIVERCLAKDPEDRYASTKDLARDLKSVRDHLSEASGAAAAAPAAPRRRPGWLFPVAAALLAGAVAGVFVGRAAANSKIETSISFQRLTYQRGAIQSARFAPDGQTIVYGASWEGRPVEIFTTRPESFEARPLGLAGDILSISPAGEMAISLGRHWVIGFESFGTLARVGLAGGTPREVLETVQDADWAPDGSALAVARWAGDIRRLEFPVGKVIQQPSGWISHVRFAPDGRRIAFLDHPQRGDDTALVKVVDREGKVLLTGPNASTGLAWSAKGDEVWSTAVRLLATSLSGKTRALWAFPGDGGIQDVARDGRALFLRESRRRELVGLAPGDAEERNLTWLDWSNPRDLSADGTTVLFDEESSSPTGRFLVYLRKTSASPAVMIGRGRSFALSPDGQWAIAAEELASTQLVLLPTGRGEPRLLPQANVHCQWADFFPDGRRLLIAGNEAGHRPRLYVRDLPGGQPRAITPEGVFTVRHSISPDGKWIAAAGPDGKLALYPSEPGPARPISGIEPEELAVRWASDGRHLYVMRQGNMSARVSLIDTATGERQLWKELRPADLAGVGQVGPIVITPDGKSYVYGYRRSLQDLYVVTGLR
ncbi:MAG TPA: protein kinase [Thermoanaerobaculia bacterium]|nr:protein kinase [Thermoanaerobaculia bacterium]